MKKITPQNKKVIYILIALIPLTIFIIWLMILRLSPTLSEQEVTKLIVEYTYDEPTESVIDLSNRLIVPKMGLDIEIFSGSEDVLEKGIWHRSSGIGDPELGGNFVISGHRFTMGFSENGLWRSSPLLNIDKLMLGDEILIIWDGNSYTYLIDEIFEVAPTQIEIEDPSDVNFMTLYTCTLEGSSDGRYVIRATPQ